jgi:CarboxypepD_reg-like domain
MKTDRRFTSFSSKTLSISILFFSQIIFAQSQIKGKITYGDNDAPAAYASVELANDKGANTISDNAGHFNLNIKESQKRDSIIISSVGYKTLRMPVAVAINKSVFRLTEAIKTIEDVTVFTTHNVIGSTSESVGYYRSWSYNHTGGEIGRIFKLPYKKFKIDKIRFKAGNTCDTCSLRLHMRTVVDGEPGEEIFKDSVLVLVNRLSLDSKISEFDLTPFNFTFTQNEFFVGIELLNCGNGKNGTCAFNFAGTEKGEYFFKSNNSGQWKSTDDYTIYLKLFLRF